ncbi:hypothetical protein MIMGU_mgv1a010710mg [Erythranthe guttata]|uniref:Uncharacterized protein n=1 Tax=Erythranthe guttata TaxID=4155 RepID=A0A022QHN9_ERYGU|nr:hypothetical protein MIMGU_mgv1a010710mg [Erythranthe guttata]
MPCMQAQTLCRYSLHLHSLQRLFPSQEMLRHAAEDRSLLSQETSNPSPEAREYQRPLRVQRLRQIRGRLLVQWHRRRSAHALRAHAFVRGPRISRAHAQSYIRVVLSFQELLLWDMQRAWFNPTLALQTPPEAAAAILSRLAPSAPQLPPIQMRQKNVTMPRDPLMMNINDVAYGFSLGVPVSPSFHEVNRKLDNDLALLTVQKMIVNRSNAIAQAVQQMIVNNSEAIAQGILISGGRGYGGGEKEGLHLLTDLICVLTNAGGSGGGGQDSVNNGGGGGGAGGAGAGGGTDYVPSFPGDGKAWY